MPKVVPEYKEEAKRRIIDAGFAVMSKKGYCAMKMDDIAAHLGVSKGTLYVYFKTKDELVLEIIKTIHEDVEATAKAGFNSTAPLEAWTAMLDYFMAKQAANNSLFTEVMAMAARSDSIREGLSQKIAIWIDSATDGIASQQSQGLVRQDTDPRTLALVIVSIFLGLQNLAVTGVDRKEIRERWVAMGKLLLPSMTSEEKIPSTRINICPLVTEILTLEQKNEESLKIPSCPADCQNYTKCRIQPELPGQ